VAPASCRRFLKWRRGAKTVGGTPTPQNHSFPTGESHCCNATSVAAGPYRNSFRSRVRAIPRWRIGGPASESLLLAQPAHERGEILDLRFLQALCVRGHFILALRDDVDELRVSLFLHIRRSEIARTKLLPCRRVSLAMRPVARNALRLIKSRRIIGSYRDAHEDYDCCRYQ
jgi:hypothetical protein